MDNQNQIPAESTVGALFAKHKALIEQKEQLKKEFETKIAEIDNALSSIGQAAAVIEKAAAACKCRSCGGTGKITDSDTDGFGTRDMECATCKGTGINLEMQGFIAGKSCEKCYGSGKIRRTDAAGQMETETCPECKGSGISSYRETKRIRF